ncbi:hypothetical protein I4U23_011030 [Adineta vaga]|nr:hypothetical protein I4U23_011030 [Adineta vaga]
MSASMICLVLMFLVSANEMGVDAQHYYDTTCSCNSMLSSGCMSYSCKSTYKMSCFAGSSQVTLEDGTFKLISDVKINDRVLVDKQNLYEPIIGFIHSKREGLFDFLAIDVQSDVSNVSTTIYVSANHLIFDFDSDQARFAGNFRIGDQMKLVHHYQIVPGKVTNIRLMKREGYYAPMTPSGKIVVDGVLASNYATVSNHALAHQVMGIYRTWIRLVGSSTSNEQLSWMLQIMMYVEKIFQWSGGNSLINNHIYDGKFEVTSII